MRTLNTIANDIRDRLFSKEIIAFFVERTDDFLALCNMIGKTFAPYIQQFERLNDIYVDAELLNKYLISKGLITDGFENNLNSLQDFAKKSTAILRSRGTLKHKLELGRLFTVDTSDTNLFEHQILNYDKTGWDLRVNSPCYKDVFSNTLNLCYMRLEELYMVNAKNYNVNRTTEQIVDILKQKFFPLHINSCYEKKNSSVSLGKAGSPLKININNNIVTEVFHGKYNEKFHIRLKFKNLYSPTDTNSNAVEFLNFYNYSDTLYFCLYFNCDEKFFTLFNNYNSDSIDSVPINNIYGKYGKPFILDFFYDNSFTSKKTRIYLDGKMIIDYNGSYGFNFTETCARLKIGFANYDWVDNQYDLLGFEIENDLFGKMIYEDFDLNTNEVNAEGKFGNENYKYFINS